jgi:cystathionine beta-synthase
MIYDNILETIGNTPMVKINNLYRDLPGTFAVKLETFNPGHSTKDRMALKMIEEAETSGALRPGGTIIECTSGNTGMGIAIAASIKGYRCIFTTNDKQSIDKTLALRAMGAEVHICPTAVAADHPDSYYSVAERIHQATPNSVWLNQYDNLANRQAHYESTGPEIWEQSEGKITHFIVGAGTGGTISGVGKYLKEQNPEVKIWGVDAYGSALKKYHEEGIIDETEIYAYITEGIGEDIIPKNYDFEVIDEFIKVSDKDGALGARELALQEGLLMGYSAGSVVRAVHQKAGEFTADSLVVMLIHDHGSRYLNKVYNDEWMREQGFL